MKREPKAARRPAPSFRVRSKHQVSFRDRIAATALPVAAQVDAATWSNCIELTERMIGLLSGREEQNPHRDIVELGDLLVTLDPADKLKAMVVILTDPRGGDGMQNYLQEKTGLSIPQMMDCIAVSTQQQPVRVESDVPTAADVPAYMEEENGGTVPLTAPSFVEQIDSPETASWVSTEAEILPMSMPTPTGDMGDQKKTFMDYIPYIGIAGVVIGGFFLFRARR